MNTIHLTDTENILLKKLLGELDNLYACAACNDFVVESTPEMASLVATIQEAWENENGVPKEDRNPFPVEHKEGGKIETMDFEVLRYFLKKFGLEELKTEETT